MSNVNTWYKKELKPYAQQLRREMTPEERKLWNLFLKTLDCTVKRQKIIEWYIADFYIPKTKLVIELDGSRHYTDDGREYDEQRNELMESLGLEVIRFSNNDVNNHFDSVCEKLRQKLQ